MMKAVFFDDKRKVSVRDVEAPQCLPGTVLLRVEMCGICGSDLHVFDGQWPRPDKPIGHEMAGRVIEIGEGAEGFSPGDLVCAEALTHCGRCVECRTGNYNVCSNRGGGKSHGKLTGAFAQIARVPAEIAYRMPPDATAEQAVLAEPTAVACRAASLANARPGDRILVIGGGTIGLLCAAVLKARLRLQCMVVAKYEHQASLAKELGADAVHLITSGKTADAVRAFTGGRSGVDAVIDTVGSTIALADAADAIRPQGTIVLLALPGGRTIMPIHATVGKELRLVGSNCYGWSGAARDFDSAIELITSGVVPAPKIITHRFPLDQAQAAFDAAAGKSAGSVKVILTP